MTRPLPIHGAARADRSTPSPPSAASSASTAGLILLTDNEVAARQRARARDRPRRAAPHGRAHSWPRAACRWPRPPRMLAAILIGAPAAPADRRIEGAIAMSQGIALQQSINLHPQPGNRGRRGRHPAAGRRRLRSATRWPPSSSRWHAWRAWPMARNPGTAAGSPGHAAIASPSARNAPRQFRRPSR